MQLNTRCPACETVFPVSLEQLQLRKGYIRCVQCAHIFDGFEAAVPAEPARSQTGAAPKPAEEPVIPSLAAEQAAAGADERPAHSGFIIPPPGRVHVNDAAQPTRPFSIGRDRAAEGGAPRQDEPSLSQGAVGAHAPSAPEHRIPSVLRGRDDMRGPGGVAGPSFTISEPRSRMSGGRDEPGMAGAVGRASLPEPATSTHRLGPDETESEPPLFMEPQVTRRSGRYEPEFLGREQPRKAWLTPLWAVLTLCGLVLLAGQGIYVYRAQLANNAPSLRPLLEGACARIGCAVPYERNIQAIAITGSALRSSGPPDGDVSNLVLEVALRNTHGRPQEWPTLVLDLKDASGAVVVRRNLGADVWVPADYKDGPFAAGAELKVQLPIAVRGLQPNGYQLDKYFP